MVTRSEDYSNFVHRLFNNGNLGLEACRNVTFQVTGDCNCAVRIAMNITRAAAHESGNREEDQLITSSTFTRTAPAILSTKTLRVSFWISSVVSRF